MTLMPLPLPFRMAAACMLVACDSAPSVRSVSLEPTAPHTATTLSCRVDADGSQEQLRALPVSWTVDGQRVAEVSTWQLEGLYFRKGQRVSCSAVGPTGEITSEPITVGNTPPAFDDAELVFTPPRPQPTSEDASQKPWTPEAVELRTFGFFDVDGDPEAWHIRWTVDGEPVEAVRSLALAPLRRDDEAPLRVAVSVAPWDGEAEGEALERELLVGATAP